MELRENVPRRTANVQRPRPETIRHLYVHIPFCARICPYCAFYKERADPARTQQFCQALVRELQAACARFEVQAETIFFGGGTPTALSTAQLDYLLGEFQQTIAPAQLTEWTMEANPGSVSARKAALMKARGVTRISLGVQSWDDALLQILGREHNAAQAEASFRILREAGFENLNIDLMFGLPGQTLAQWESTLAQTIALNPEHISAYCLTYEEDTEFFLRQVRGEYRSDQENDARFFETTMQMLEGAGYRQYEISNYARPGFASAHNRGYWRGGDYLGLGPSAFSTVGMERWQNVADYRIYSDELLAGKSVIRSNEQLSAAMKRGEQIVLMLRTDVGLPASWLAPWPAECAEFIELGLLERAGEQFVLTQKGKLLADSVGVAFV